MRAPITLPQVLWEELKQSVPSRDRSAIVAGALRRELDWLKREAKRRGVEVADLVLQLVGEDQRKRLKAQGPGAE